MTSRKQTVQPERMEPRKYLYLLLAGFLDEAFNRPDMLQGGPFDAKKFPQSARYLLELVLKDPRISEAQKQAAQEHFNFCNSLFKEHIIALSTAKFQASHLKERQEIEGIVRKLTEPKSA